MESHVAGYVRVCTFCAGVCGCACLYVLADVCVVI